MLRFGFGGSDGFRSVGVVPLSDVPVEPSGAGGCRRFKVGRPGVPFSSAAMFPAVVAFAFDILSNRALTL